MEIGNDGTNLQKSRYLADLEWRNFHAVNIYVYKNGVGGTSPHLVHIPPEKKCTMKGILELLNERLKYPVGYAKTIYKMDGQKILEPCELEMYANYVVANSNDRHFKPVQYGKNRNPLLVLSPLSKHARATGERCERYRNSFQPFLPKNINPLLTEKFACVTPKVSLEHVEGRNCPYSNLSYPQFGSRDSQHENHGSIMIGKLGGNGQDGVKIQKVGNLTMKIPNTNNRRILDINNNENCLTNFMTIHGISCKKLDSSYFSSCLPTPVEKYTVSSSVQTASEYRNELKTENRIEFQEYKPTPSSNINEKDTIKFLEIIKDLHRLASGKEQARSIENTPKKVDCISQTDLQIPIVLENILQFKENNFHKIPNSPNSEILIDEDSIDRKMVEISIQTDPLNCPIEEDEKFQKDQFYDSFSSKSYTSVADIWKNKKKMFLLRF